MSLPLPERRTERRLATGLAVAVVAAAAISVAITAAQWVAGIATDTAESVQGGAWPSWLLPFLLGFACRSRLAFWAGRQWQGITGARNFAKGQRKLIREGLPR